MKDHDAPRQIINNGWVHPQEYHSLLPEYVQDILRRAASKYPDNPRKRMIYIEDAIEAARKTCPERFR